jgi:hypothetical protein
MSARQLRILNTYNTKWEAETLATLEQTAARIATEKNKAFLSPPPPPLSDDQVLLAAKNEQIFTHAADTTPGNIR